MGFEPFADGAVGDVSVGFAAHDALSFRDGVSEVERGDGLNDCFERIGLVLGGCSSETV